MAADLIYSLSQPQELAASVPWHCSCHLNCMGWRISATPTPLSSSVSAMSFLQKVRLTFLSLCSFIYSSKVYQHQLPLHFIGLAWRISLNPIKYTFNLTCLIAKHIFPFIGKLGGIIHKECIKTRHYYSTG